MDQPVPNVVSDPQSMRVAEDQHPSQPAARRSRRPLSAAPDRMKLPAASPYISPKELAARWRVARSTVEVLVRQHGITRLCLGEGKNGTVRYKLDDVLRFEQTRLVVSAA